MALVSNRLWTSNLLESNIRIVRTTKPVETPVATSLELLWETVTLRAL
jgi:hypothetical protein